MKLSIVCTLLATLFSAISAVPSLNDRETKSIPTVPDKPHPQREQKKDDDSPGKNDQKPDDNKSHFDLNRHLCQQACYDRGGSLDELLYCLNKCEVKRGRKLMELEELDSNKPHLAFRPPDIPPVPRDIACQHDCLYSSSTPLEYVECKRGCPKSTDSSNRDDARITPSVREEIPTRPDYYCIIRCFQRSSSSNEVNKCITNECGGRGTEIAVEANVQKGSNSLPESHRHLFTLPDDDSWGSIPPGVRCHVACYEFAANNEKFQECNRDCLSEPSNESEIVANETEDKNESENDLSGSQRQLISQSLKDWYLPPDVGCQLGCYYGTSSAGEFHQCSKDCFSQPDRAAETNEKKSNLRGSDVN